MSKWGTRGAYRRARNQYNASWRKARNARAKQTEPDPQSGWTSDDFPIAIAVLAVFFLLYVYAAIK